MVTDDYISEFEKELNETIVKMDKLIADPFTDPSKVASLRSWRFAIREWVSTKTHRGYSKYAVYELKKCLPIVKKLIE